MGQRVILCFFCKVGNFWHRLLVSSTVVFKVPLKALKIFEIVSLLLFAINTSFIHVQVSSVQGHLQVPSITSHNVDLSCTKFWIWCYPKNRDSINKLLHDSIPRNNGWPRPSYFSIITTETTPHILNSTSALKTQNPESNTTQCADWQDDLNKCNNKGKVFPQLTSKSGSHNSHVPSLLFTVCITNILSDTAHQAIQYAFPTSYSLQGWNTHQIRFISGTRWKCFHQ